jgi:hypothetical protein
VTPRVERERASCVADVCCIAGVRIWPIASHTAVQHHTRSWGNSRHGGQRCRLVLILPSGSCCGPLAMGRTRVRKLPSLGSCHARIGLCFAVECRTSPKGSALVDAALAPLPLSVVGTQQNRFRPFKTEPPCCLGKMAKKAARSIALGCDPILRCLKMRMLGGRGVV